MTLKATNLDMISEEINVNFTPFQSVNLAWVILCYSVPASFKMLSRCVTIVLLQALTSFAPHCDAEMRSIREKTPLLSQIWEDLQDAEKIEELLDTYNKKANSLAFGGSQLSLELLKAFNALIVSLSF